MSDIEAAMQAIGTRPTIEQPAVLDLQRTTLAMFARLFAMRQNWSRHFVACFSCGAPDQALALAVLGLGGAILLISEDAVQLRSANRAGATDFQVDGLSEALRILKNEVRKGTAVSVGLFGDPGTIAGEMRLRGVQPDAVALDSAQFATEFATGFVENGAQAISLDHHSEAHEPWILTHHFDSAITRTLQDRDLQSAFQNKNAEVPEICVNRRWLSIAPRLFPRDLHRHFLSSNLKGAI